MTTTLTKADMAENLYMNLGLSKREANEVVQCFFNAIAEALSQGEYVKLSGFGSFYLRDKSERMGRDLRTGVAVTVKERRVVTFRAGRKLRDLVDESQGQLE